MPRQEKNQEALLGELLKTAGLRLALAESCTGGLVAAAVTSVPGSSEWFDRGFVTYSNAAKSDMLDVPSSLIEANGAVSEAVARAMAQGAKKHSTAEITGAITGVAGPSGGTPEKPVGLVWFAWSWPDGNVQSECRQFPGSRAAVRQAARDHLLHTIISRLEQMGG